MIINKLIESIKYYKLNKKIGKLGKNSKILLPTMLGRPDLVFMDDYTCIMPHSKLILNKGRLIIKKYTRIAPGVTIVSDNHTPTVGIPYFFTGSLHINDRSSDIIIGEDCWIGANVTILPGSKIGRGCMIGSCALLNKEYPPYSLVVGIPGKIKGVKFTKQQIIEHEKSLYPEKERMTEAELDILFETYYMDCKSFGTDKLSDEDKDKYISSRKF